MLNTNEKGSFIRKLTEVIEANSHNEQFGVNDLAREMRMSRSSLHRKIKSSTGKSASKFICDVRLDRAIQLLKEPTLTIAEIAYECGFHSASYFSRCFRDRFGYPPGEARNRPDEHAVPENLSRQKEKKGFAKRKILVIYFLTALCVVIMVSVVIFVWKPFDKADRGKDISIAVLPFFNDSPDESDMYFINGCMEAIYNNLCKIEALDVISRTSVERYRNNPKSAKDVADELKVRYLVAGSGLKQGDRIILNLQLVDAKKDKYIWAESRQKNINEVFELYGEVAQLVAQKVKATVTPKEKKLIEKVPTRNMTAYELYLIGLDENPYSGTGQYSLDISKLKHKETLYRRALKYDTTFASLYAELAYVNIDKIKNTGRPSDNLLDTVRYYIEKALLYDEQLPTAYLLRGFYYNLLGNTARAIDDFNRAIELDPNDPRALHGQGWNYMIIYDYPNALDCFHKNELLFRGPDIETTLNGLRQAYLFAGCAEQSIRYARKLLEMNQDSADYFFSLGLNEYILQNNPSKAIELLRKGMAIDPGNLKILGALSQVYYVLGRYEEAQRAVETKNGILAAEDKADIYQAFLAGFIYKKNGDQDRADYFFDQQIGYCESLINSEKFLHGQMAMAYAGKGDKEKAMEHLWSLNQMERMNVTVLQNLRDDSFFECIQNEPEYKEIRNELIAKYQAEHERVMQWLKENELL